MRTGLFSDLSAIGYEIILEGDYIKLRYRKPDTPPESARQLIEELRQCKQEAIALLTTNKHMAIWPPEVQALMDWFMKLEPPETPFYLEPHRQVVDPDKFFASLRQEITLGPDSPRGRNGALLYDLNTLRKNLH
jgi:hypothetical protein